MSSAGQSHSGESLYLVDAHSLIHQVFHALPEMTSPQGLPTNAVFGFTKDLLYLRNEIKPTYLVCAFDVPGGTFRDKIYDQYKANRKAMPDDLQLQIPMIHEVLEAMRIPKLGVEGFEADDLIATLARLAAEQGIEVFICSADKDLRQLLTDKVHVYSLRKREVYNADSLLADWGIRPDQVIDFQTLVGDSVDNVQGVPGIGPKTATQLLQEFGTLDNLLANIEKVPGKKKDSIKASASIIQTSRQLVRLETHMNLEAPFETWRIQPWDGPKLHELFRGYGFRAFADQLKDTLAPPPPKKKKAPPTKEFQGSLFGDDEPMIEDEGDGVEPLANDNWDADYRLVQTPEQFDRFLSELRQQKRFAIDLETTHLEPRRAEIVGIAISWKPAEAWYLALRGPERETVLDQAMVFEQLGPILKNPDIAKVNQNIKYDLQVFRQQGMMIQGVAGDSMVADYLLHAGERTHGLDVLAEKHLQHRNISIETLIGKGRHQKRMDQIPLDKVAEYAGEDADVALRLCDLLEPQLAEKDLKKLYDDVEVPLIYVLADMEFTGIRLDLPFLKKLGDDMGHRLVELERDIHRLAGREFNIASVKQMRDVLFKEQGFKPSKKTSILREASTDQETLEELAKEHELPRRILEHRQIAKLKGTYVDALPALVNPDTGRLHTSFNQTVATTGRLSSSDPNLQNIPIRSEEGEQIRRAFLPESGWKLITADYSQIELRLLADLSKDEALTRAFEENRDIHTSVAAQVFGIADDQVTSGQRRMAKAINFGIIYGMSAFGLAMRLDISRDEAAQFIDAYFARFPKVLAYQDGLLAKCLREGYVATILGRRRAIVGIRKHTTYKSRNQPEREAINMQVQGSAADLIKVAMLNLSKRLKKEGLRSRLLLQIHDELVFEAPPEELERAPALIRSEMAGALGSLLHVPIGVDLEVGDNWLDTVKVGD